MVEKDILHNILKNLNKGGIKVTYWDGDTQTYGCEEPYSHVTIRSPRVARALLKNVSLGFGESYSNGLLKIDGDLSGPARFARENSDRFSFIPNFIKTARLNKNTRGSQRGYIAHHYDLGNDFYKMWLDKSMTYSCAYYKKASDTLEAAQKQKIEYLLKKLRLSKGQSLLDIGSGWGDLLITAAKDYGATGLGVTLSEEQLKHSKEAAKKTGVDDRVDFELANFQDLPARGLTFDRIVSVGMFEHVGRGNHHHYYKAINDMLAPDGLSVLHTITQQTEKPTDSWIDKYIFPGGYIPSSREIFWALPEYGFRITDYENLRIHYAMTLDEWQNRYRTHRKKVLEMFDEDFYRMWDFWLACSAAAFRFGNLDLSQFVFTKGIQNSLPLTRVEP